MKKIAALAVWVTWLSAVPAAIAQARTALSAHEALYPRVVRLTHNALTSNNGILVSSVTAFPGGSGQEDIFQSSNGIAFAPVGSVTDAAFGSGLCCGTLYELPSPIGALPRGTLLWAGSVGGDTPSIPMQIRIYQSTDQGVTWTYLSNCATGTVNRSVGGLWEPQFTVANSGELVCFYSDETLAGFSQLIQAVRSSDGIHWSTPAPAVASTVAADRPGMAVVTALPNGQFFMTYELCGAAACAVNSKTSPDGVNWTLASNLGNRIQTASNQWFEHTPMNAWAPATGFSNGRLFVVGQLLIHDGGIDPDNGRAVFVNDSLDGSLPWTLLPAPVNILNPPATSNVCQNYSSPLLPSADGSSLLELASDYDSSSGTPVCTTFFATGPTSVAGLTLSVPNITTGAAGSAMATVVVTPNAGYRGTVALGVAVPGFPGMVTVAPASVTFVSDSPATATLNATLATTAAQAAPASLSPLHAGEPVLRESLHAGGGGTALASVRLAMLISAVGFMRRRPFAMLGASILLIVALADCGGGGSSSPSMPTTATYTGSVNAVDVSDATITAKGAFTLTVTH